MADDKFFLYQNDMPDNNFFTHYRSNIPDTPLHWHNFIEIEIVLGGSAEHIHNGISSALKRGHVSIFRINDYHAIKNTKDLEVLNLRIKDTAIPEKTLSQLNYSSNNLSFDLNEETFKTVLFFCDACIKENSQLLRSDTYIRNILDCILILLLRLDSNQTKPVKKQHNSQLNKAINYLHSHFRENPSLSAVAETVHYSPTHFSHVFHKKIGKPYNDYLNELKIAYAKQLLTTTNLKVIDVGYQSGFNSYNNFYSTFKQHTNLSPAEYKKKKPSNMPSTGYSWKFAIINTDINTNPAYIFIDTDPLKPNTEYCFSYFFSYDYEIAVDGVLNSQLGEEIEVTDLKKTDLKSKKRTNKVEFCFKTTAEAPYRITLKMGKGLNNVNCEYRFTKLSNLNLFEKNGDAKINLAQKYTFAGKNISWTENSDAYEGHIDR